MIDYRRLGSVSPKAHTKFEVEGKMVSEHVFTREGFSDLYSILYQRRAPTHETRSDVYVNKNPLFPHKPSELTAELKRRHVKTFEHKAGGSLLENRATLFYNSDCTVGVAKPNRTSPEFFSNGDADELYFVAEGTGTLQTIFGELPYHPGDYLFIPKGVPYRFQFSELQNFFIVEGNREFGVPREFRQVQGQLKLDAPYAHRDFRSPEKLLTFTAQDNFPIVVQKGGKLTIHEYTEWPYQVLGWDGWVFPFAFPISAYQPKTSSVHLPPNIHTVFAARGFVMMNFVPRVLDYAPNAVPCPYPHSSVDCDEILFYVEGHFTSRKGISQYSISHHPGGIPHGPHPEMYEKSVGLRESNELAIMVDTFAPLIMTQAAQNLEDAKYHFSWDTADHL